MKGYRYIITTTRRSNPRTRSLAKDFARVLPRALKLNRGKMRLSELVEYALSLGATGVVVVGRGLQGNPGRLEIIALSGRQPRSLVLKLRGVKLARELGVPRPRPSIELAVVAKRHETALELGHELAVALNLPLFEADDPSSLKGVCDSVILVEPVPVGLAVRFVTPSGEPNGPRLLVEKFVSVVKHALQSPADSENTLAVGG